MKRTRSPLGRAPATDCTGSPPLKIVSVGTDITRYAMAVSGFSSMLSLTISTLPANSVAISLSSGSTLRHGAHHSAQKSTRTGTSDCSTSLVKVASVTTLVAPMWSFLSGRERCWYVSDVVGERSGRQRCDVALGVERRGAARAGRRDGLTVSVVDEVAGGEH